MQFWDLVFQIITIVFFAVFLEITVTSYQERSQTYFLMFFFLSWLSAGAAITILMKNYLVLESDLSGWLVPANDPMPDHPCPDIPEKAISIYYGGSLGYTTQFPFVALRIGEEDLITIKKIKGFISVSARVYSRDHRIVAEIEDNEFHINPNNYFRRERPDRYTLIVYDQQGRIVLNVRFLNKRAIRIMGIFDTPGRPPVVIHERQIRFGTHIFERNCMMNKRIGLDIS